MMTRKDQDILEYEKLRQPIICFQRSKVWYYNLNITVLSVLHIHNKVYSNRNVQFRLEQYR